MFIRRKAQKQDNFRNKIKVPFKSTGQFYFSAICVLHIQIKSMFLQEFTVKLYSITNPKY